MRPAAALLAVVAVATVTAASCNRETATEPAERRPRVVLLALDAASWKVLDPLIERGLLPNLARLKQGGTSAVLQSDHPSASPVIWTSVATGKKPAKHGITGFIAPATGDEQQPRPVTRTMRRSKTLWNVAGDAGFDVAVVGWFVTWPVEAINGRMISDRAHHTRLDQRTFPPGYLTALPVPTEPDAVSALAGFVDLHDKLGAGSRADPATEVDPLVRDRLVKACRRDLYYARAAARVLDDGPLPDLFALYLRGTDDTQHGFWKFMDPVPFGDVPADEVSRFGKVIEGYWRWTDALVGDILERYDDTALVVVVSDHGAGPALGKYRVGKSEDRLLSGAHRPEGVLIARGPGIRRGAWIDNATIYDIAPSLLHYLGLAVADDLDGRVLADAFEGELAGRPVRTVATHETLQPTPPVARSSAVDEELLEHLRSLGYID